MKRRNFITALLGLVGGSTMSASYAGSESKHESGALLIQQASVSGFQFHEGEQLYTKFQLGDALTLKRSPENLFDTNAVEVYWREHMIGHIPSSQNSAISQMMDRGEKLTASISQLNPSDVPWEKVQLAVYCN